MTAAAILAACLIGIGVTTIAYACVIAGARADRLSEQMQALRHRAAEADEIALSIGLGGASTFQHTIGDN